MAARKLRGTTHEGWAEEVRERIRASMLVNRMISHALGEVEMTPTQVRAAEILMRKALPDLTAVEHSGEVTKNYVARLPAKVGDIKEWQKQHSAPTIQ